MVHRAGCNTSHLSLFDATALCGDLTSVSVLPFVKCYDTVQYFTCALW